LSAFCVEGNVIDGGLDTADDSSAPVKEAAKKAKKRSLYNAQEEMVKVMQLRREDELKSQAISMRKDLTVSISILSATWSELDKTLISLEDSPDFETNPRKIARHTTYSQRMKETEEEMQNLKLELKRFSETQVNLAKPSEVVENVLNMTSATEESGQFTADIAGDFDINLNDSVCSDDLNCRMHFSAVFYCCCGCSTDASNTSHFCSVTGKHVMAYCLSEGSIEVYGSRGVCRGCSAKSTSSSSS
jgi:hypothetical protein